MKKIFILILVFSLPLFSLTCLNTASTNTDSIIASIPHIDNNFEGGRIKIYESMDDLSVQNTIRFHIPNIHIDLSHVKDILTIKGLPDGIGYSITKDPVDNSFIVTFTGTLAKNKTHGNTDTGTFEFHKYRVNLSDSLSIGDQILKKASIDFDFIYGDWRTVSHTHNNNIAMFSDYNPVSDTIIGASNFVGTSSVPRILDMSVSTSIADLFHSQLYLPPAKGHTKALSTGFQGYIITLSDDINIYHKMTSTNYTLDSTHPPLPPNTDTQSLQYDTQVDSLYIGGKETISTNKVHLYKTAHFYTQNFNINWKSIFSTTGERLFVKDFKYHGSTYLSVLVDNGSTHTFYVLNDTDDSIILHGVVNSIVKQSAGIQVISPYGQKVFLVKNNKDAINSIEMYKIDMKKKTVNPKRFYHIKNIIFKNVDYSNCFLRTVNQQVICSAIGYHIASSFW